MFRNNLLGRLMNKLNPTETPTANLFNKHKRQKAMRDSEISRLPVVIDVAYSYSKIKGNPLALKQLEQIFALPVRGAQYNNAFKNRRWDGKCHLIHPTAGIFGTGLLKLVCQKLEMLNINYSISDLRVKPPRRFSYEYKGFSELRDVQERALTALLKEDCTSGIVDMVMGAGKTAVFLKLIEHLGVFTLITVPTLELLRQTAKSLQAAFPGITIGILGGGQFPDGDCEVVVAMNQSLVATYKKVGKETFINAMAQFDMLISDECHTICSGDRQTKTWEAIMNIPTYYRFGFSATPFDQTGSAAEFLMRAAFGDVLIKYGAHQAMEEHVIVPFTVYMRRLTYPEHYKNREYSGQDWILAHEDMICENDIRNEDVVNTAVEMYKAGRKVVVVAQRIPHNCALYDMICSSVKADQEIFQLHGGMKKEERVETIKQLSAKKSCIVVASSVINTGVDVADINGIVVAHGGKSLYQTLQRIGRGLRNADGKTCLIVVDYDDSDLGRWFKQHTERRIELYNKINGVVKQIRVHNQE